MRRISIALVHYPVLDREGSLVVTAITNLDLHDMARSVVTYGADAMYVVHPVEAQRQLASRIQEHWVSGTGKRRIPDRATALACLRIVPAIDDAVNLASEGAGRPGLEIWTTAASARGRSVSSYAEARERLQGEGPPVLILFGTGWGLASSLTDAADLRLEPIRARSDTGFNHLSVRAACAITLDRLLG